MEQGRISFEEADRRYVEDKRQYDNGHISYEEFGARLEQNMVRDAEDRWWVKSRRTGQWNYYNDEADTWVESIPPDPDYRRGPATDEPMIRTSSEQSRLRDQMPVQERPGLWIAGAIITALAGITIIPFPLSWLSYLLGIYFGYRARQKGSMGGGTGAMVLNGAFVFIELLLYVVSGCTTLACL